MRRPSPPGRERRSLSRMALTRARLAEAVAASSVKPNVT
jgi:hypothetical protein